jgi:hypothetical protein
MWRRGTSTTTLRSNHDIDMRVAMFAFGATTASARGGCGLILVGHLDCGYVAAVRSLDSTTPPVCCQRIGGRCPTCWTVAALGTSRRGVCAEANGIFRAFTLHTVCLGQDIVFRTGT